MLRLGEEVFAYGVADYYTEDPSLSTTQTSVHVNIVLEGGLSIATTARLDPATPWVVLNAELNRTIGLRATGEKYELYTLEGRMRGSLERFPITLPAQDGDALEIDATLFVCDDWTRGNFLGYSGFLERIRFALDPHYCRFYFGPLPELAPST